MALVVATTFSICYGVAVFAFVTVSVALCCVSRWLKRRTFRSYAFDLRDRKRKSTRTTSYHNSQNSPDMLRVMKARSKETQK